MLNWLYEKSLKYHEEHSVIGISLYLDKLREGYLIKDEEELPEDYSDEDYEDDLMMIGAA